MPGLDEVKTLKLKHLCREVITLDPGSHLFNRIPRRKLQDYLLNSMSLEMYEDQSKSHEDKRQVEDCG